MHITDADSEILKSWIIKKLEDVSDADSDVLADYVLALLKSEEPEAVVKVNCIDNLEDFLGNNARTFVESVFTAIATRAFDPSHKPTAQTSTPFPTQDQHHPPQNSRKRGYRDWDSESAQHGWGGDEGHERPVKQMRRGRGGGNGSHRGRGHGHNGNAHAYGQRGASQMPAFPSGMPTFDPNDPMAAFRAMQQLMGMMPGMNAMMEGMSKKEQCRDYNRRGFCARGAQCPYEHGPSMQQPLTNDEYNPNQAQIPSLQAPHASSLESSPNGNKKGIRHNARQNNRSRQANRAPFSHGGMNHDRSITSVVVEQIPEESFDEQVVRAFFSEFGAISEVDMQPYKRLAIVKFDSYDSARAAYDSPKVIFDNRFVKVYWYKPESANVNGKGAEPRLQDTAMADVEAQVDHEEVARRQEELQRKHEEKQRQNAEAAQKREEVDAKLRAMETERQTMLSKLARKGGDTGVTTNTASGSEKQESEQTKGLRAQLAKLEAEAKSMGIDPNAPDNSYSTSWQPLGRGGYRGRGRGRGGYPPFRGGFAGGAVKRLDNRPKTVLVSYSSDSHDEHDEAIRQWLLFNSGEGAEFTPHPERADAALIAFPERYLGEMFMASASAPDFPSAGSIELSWYQPNSTPKIQETNVNAREDAAPHDTTMGHDQESRRDDDFDIAEDHD